MVVVNGCSKIIYFVFVSPTREGRHLFGTLLPLGVVRKKKEDGRGLSNVKKKERAKKKGKNLFAHTQ